MMNVFFQVTWNQEKQRWVATAFERATVKGQPPTVLVSAVGEEPTDALQSCCEKLEDS